MKTKNTNFGLHHYELLNNSKYHIRAAQFGQLNMLQVPNFKLSCKSFVLINNRAHTCIIHKYGTCKERVKDLHVRNHTVRCMTEWISISLLMK